MTTPVKKEPTDKLQDGGIKATIWANKTDKGTFYSTTVSRTYHDGNNYQTTNSYGGAELPSLKPTRQSKHTIVSSI